jgi:hypothetical protein
MLAFGSAAKKWIVSGWRPSIVDNIPGFNIHISKLAFKRSAANEWIVSGWRHSIVPPELHRVIIIADVAVSPV